MEELEKLYCKPKEYKIPIKPVEGQVQATIQLMPLSLEDSDLMSGFNKDDTKEAMEASFKMLAHCMNVPVEKIKPMSFEFLTDLMDCFSDANNFQDEEKKGIEKIKGLIAEKKNESVKPS